MKIERAARTLLGAAAFCLLLMNAGCNGALSGNNSSSGSSGSITDPNNTPSSNVKAPGDWGASLLAGGTVGIGQFPAKFTMDVNATPDCTNDFTVFNTSHAGVSPTAAATRTGQWTATVATSGTVTITSTEGTLVLTASTTVNTGLNFQIITSQSVEATNLVAAINRNNFATLGAGHVKVRAATSGTAGQVVVTASVDGTTNLNGAEGNLIGLTNTINTARFAWAGATMTGGAGSANVAAFNNLYATQGSAGGLCNQDGPSAYWSYYTGTGGAVTSVVLSGNGDKVAFVENSAASNLRILKWKAGEGAGAGFPATVTTTLTAGQNWTTNCPAANSCIRSIVLSGNNAVTRSAPFYDYKNDVLYVGDDSSLLHKIVGVFLGTPTECVAGVVTLCGTAAQAAAWPITVTGATILTSPVYDAVSQNIFVGGSSGLLRFIKEVGSTVGAGACAVAGTPAPTACLGTASLAVGTGGAIVDSPIVDPSTGRVFAVNGTETANRGTILQATTALTGAVSFDIGGTGAGSALYSGAFDDTYINSPSNNVAGHMYVCGKDTAFTDRPALYQLSFTPATGVLSSVGTPRAGLVSGSGEACSPVTEFFNPNGGGAGTPKDWIFFSIGDAATNGAPIPVGGCRTDQNGCILAFDATGSPTVNATTPATFSNAVSVPTNTAGATSGFVVDNTSASAQASSFYFTIIPISTGAGPGLPSCNTTAGIGCAVKLTQSGLN